MWEDRGPDTLGWEWREADEYLETGSTPPIPPELLEPRLSVMEALRRSVRANPELWPEDKEEEEDVLLA